MKSVHIFIASCYEGIEIQIPRLIKNLHEVNIPSEYIHFIIGGCPDENIEYRNGIELVCVKYRCFEFTPMIYISNNPEKYDFEYGFFTHDTVKFGNTFYETIKNDISLMGQFDCMKIENNISSMNIGIYSKKSILNNRQTLDEITLYTNDPNHLMNMKNKLVDYEDFILNQSNYNNGDTSEMIPTQFTGIKNVKANGLLRIFKRIDFIKYQSNAYNIQSIDICKIE